MKSPRILVVDDEPGIRKSMTGVLEDEGYEVITTMDGEAITKMVDQNPDLIFLDIWMSGVNGNTICEMLMHANCEEEKRLKGGWEG